MSKITLESTATPHFKLRQEFYRAFEYSRQNTGASYPVQYVNQLLDKVDVMMKIKVRVDQTAADETAAPIRSVLQGFLYALEACLVNLELP